jgi:hypothetical protein
MYVLYYASMLQCQHLGNPMLWVWHSYRRLGTLPSRRGRQPTPEPSPSCPDQGPQAPRSRAVYMRVCTSKKNQSHIRSDTCTPRTAPNEDSLTSASMASGSGRPRTPWTVRSSPARLPGPRARLTNSAYFIKIRQNLMDSVRLEFKNHWIYCL